jgi:hypothetical protein
VFQAGLEGDPAAPGEPRTSPGPLHPPSSPEMDDTNGKRQATRWVPEKIRFVCYSACEPTETMHEADCPPRCTNMHWYTTISVLTNCLVSLLVTMCTTCYNMKLHFATFCITHMFRLVLAINTDDFAKQHSPIGHYHGNVMCPVLGRNWNFMSFRWTTVVTGVKQSAHWKWHHECLPECNNLEYGYDDEAVKNLRNMILT